MLLLTAAAANAWEFIVYPDSECESTSSGVVSGGGNTECALTPQNHRSLEIHNLGNCVLYLYSSFDDCVNQYEPEEAYDNGEEDECIAPNFIWDAYEVGSC
jgi:hypothetical protein